MDLKGNRRGTKEEIISFISTKFPSWKNLKMIITTTKNFSKKLLRIFFKAYIIILSFLSPLKSKTKKILNNSDWKLSHIYFPHFSTPN